METIIGGFLPATVDRSVVSIGNFDGIHAGHILLAKTVQQRAKVLNAASVLITFEPHTRSVIYPNETVPRLTLLKEKELLLSRLGLDYMICLNFNDSIALLEPEIFIEKVLIERFKAVEWVCGENHTFGKDKRGNHKFLHSLSAINYFSLFTVTLQSMGSSGVVSSSKIRNCILQGKIEEAVAILGHPYLIQTQRIRGEQKGKQLGIPTINFLNPPVQKVVPPHGIYTAILEWNEHKYKGALYYGKSPTFKNRGIRFEFHSIDPLDNEPPEGEIANIWIHSYIRQDREFASSLELVEQMQNDIERIKNFFIQKE